MKRNILKANTINYRKGFIEVKGDIHPNCINVETWEVDANKDISVLSLENENMNDRDIVANTEIELSLDEAKGLIKFLEEEVEKIQKKK